MTIHQLHISGFKSIHAETIELGRVNGFIGANGVGKSNMLEALDVLGAAANGVVDDEALLRRGVRAGLPRWFKSAFASARPPAHIGMGAEADPEPPPEPHHQRRRLGQALFAGRGLAGHDAQVADGNQPAADRRAQPRTGGLRHGQNLDAKKSGRTDNVINPLGPDK